MTPRRRHYHKWPCSRCHRVYSTSSHNPNYVCVPCRRMAGLPVAGKSTNGYTSLTVAPQQVSGFGTCEKCGQRNQALSNGRCEDCRFYSIPEVDWILSEQGSKSPGGRYDYIKRRNR